MEVLLDLLWIKCRLRYHGHLAVSWQTRTFPGYTKILSVACLVGTPRFRKRLAGGFSFPFRKEKKRNRQCQIINWG